MLNAYRLARFATLIALLMAASAGASDGPTILDGRWQFVPRTAESLPPGGMPGTDNFVLDDGVSEGTFGVSNASGAQQFLWFNQFDLSAAGAVALREISVQFPAGPNMAVGAAVQLVVYHDDDADPTNGATLLASFDEIIQAIDGSFSVYPIPQVDVPLGGNLLVGVISRFVMTGTTSATQPAALDTTASQGRSWFAVWMGDPPMMPTLPPDLLIDNIDNFTPGNWMIRASGGPRFDVAVPVASTFGLLVLASLVALAALAILRR